MGGECYCSMQGSINSHHSQKISVGAGSANLTKMTIYDLKLTQTQDANKIQDK